MRGSGLKRPRTRPRRERTRTGRGWSPTVRVEPIRAAATAGLEGAYRPAEAPDLIEPLSAFRCWRAVDGRLRSPYIPVFWDERLLPARCHVQATGAISSPPPHTPPHASCNCGIHAYSEPNLEFPAVDFRGVTGIVTLRGRVAMGAQGMRAELARVEALGHYSRWSRRQKRTVASIAKRLGVDLVDLDELADAAAEYGLPLLPDSLSQARAADWASVPDERHRPAGERLVLVG